MIIEIDKYKDKIVGYNPANSENFHSESGRLADLDFTAGLKSRRFKRIVFMAGGTASGKTEFAYSYLNKKDQLIYDGTLRNFKGFKVKCDKVTRYDKNHSKTKIVLIMPNDLEKAFQAFLGRDRKMRPIVFFETHAESLRTVAKILKEERIRVEIFISAVKDGTDSLTYRRVKSNGRKSLSNRLRKMADIVEGIGKELGYL